MRRDAEAPVRAGAEAAEAVAADLADAFAQDPHFDWILRPDARRAAARLDLFRLLIKDLALPKARLDRPAGGGAAAVWLDSVDMAGPPLWRELAALPVLLAATGWSRFGRMNAMRAAMDRHHPMGRRHVYLWFLGVAPRAQGLGVGSALLRAGLARLDAARLPAYLETGTERNVALYRRHGFDIVSTHRARPDAPLMWSLWREPA